MKFKHYWLNKVKELPKTLQKECLNYKIWKKRTSNSDLSELLEIECKHIDKIFHQKQDILSCFSYKNTKLDLYNYAMINKLSLYKIIKRLDKRFKINLRQWYNNNKQNYAFCGGHELTRLQLELFGYKDECPICFDKPKTVIILDCGHILCHNCVKNIYNIKELSAGIISYSMYHSHHIPKCPICRLSLPIKSLKKNQIFDNVS